jgi:hypothetical protein
MNKTLCGTDMSGPLPASRRVSPDQRPQVLDQTIVKYIHDIAPKKEAIHHA